MTLQIVVDAKLDPFFIALANQRFKGECVLDPATTRTINYVDVPDDRPLCEDDVLTTAAFNQWTEHACDVTVITSRAKRSKTSRAFNWTVFDYVFNHAGKSRLNGYISVDNVKSIAVAEMLGMKREALLEDQLGEGKHAYLYGITKKQWLEGKWADWSADPR